MTIRDATGAELEAAGDVVAGAYDHESLASDRYLARLLDARGRAASAAVLVALDGAEVVGTVTYALSGTPSAELSAPWPDAAELRALGVAPAARGRGVAEALVRACVDRARSEGRGRILLSTQTQMHAAQRLYGRLGFVRRPDLDWVPEPGVDLLGYELVL
ncbi:GNAT family N-acetyltransferase [Angustibacter aerolatus]